MSSTLYVDLDKIGRNLEVINSRLKPGIKCMAVVKDEAYGHGLLPVAQYLKDKVEWLCVARIEEAVKLREDGISLPILAFEIPQKGKEQLYKKYNVTASISDVSVFERLESGTDCHLHFDTGMYRLGMLPEEASLVLRKMKKFDTLNYTGIYTHFANADDPENPRVLQQLEVFKDIRSQFPAELMTHTCNSGAIFHYHNNGVLFDGVRPGVSLYGYAPGETDIPDLIPVLEWRSELMQVKPIKEGEAVGYGSRWRAPKDGWLGIVPVGYAHGVFRVLSSQIIVEISGKKFHQAGTISMDYMAVYLGNNKLKDGEKVTLLRNGELSAREWAKIAGTIPYEITTAISQKVEREYI